jgi:hypothetical protein
MNATPWRGVLGTIPVCAAALAAGLALGERALERGQARETERDGRGRKTWSGRSFAKSTVVELAPRASEAAPGFDVERVWSGFDDWEPAVAVDPTTSDVYQMTTRYDGPKPCKGCPLPAMVFRRSRDGGQTWDPDRFLPPTKKAQYDPQVEVATDGTVYAAWIDGYSPGVRFTKSTDRGATWSAPLTFTGNRKTPTWSDKPILAISPSGQHVYLGFNASDSWVASSHDSGASFGANVKTSNDGRYWFHTAGAARNDGTVYFATVDFTQDYTGDANLRLLRSTDGGASWTTALVDVSRELPDCPWAAGCYFGFFGSIAGLAVDSAGTIGYVYTATITPGGPPQLFFKKSTDGGASWSARAAISGAPTTAWHHSPAIAAGTTAGDFRVLWQDNRNGVPAKWNAWYRATGNGGNTWSAPVRVSDLASGAPYKSADGHAFPYGDYLELAVDATGMAHLVWGEGASFDGPGGTWSTRGE